MDPTISLIITKDSFGRLETNPYPLPIKPDVTYTNQSRYEPTIRILEGKLQTKYCNIERFTHLNDLKAKFEPTPEFEQARTRTNPFETTTKSFLNNRAPVKLANIDFVFNIMKKKWTRFDLTSDNKFKFIDIAAGPGGFTQLIQYRYPNATGVGMTLKGELDWDPKIIDINRFNIQYGPSNKGDLLADWKWFLSYLINNYKDCDLLTGDGAFEIDDPSRIFSQEQVNSELFVKQVVQTIAMPQGSNAVIKLFDANSDLTAGILYALSLSYESISLFKPCTSRPANSERYIVCLNKVGNDTANKALYQAANNPNANTIFDEIPQDFLNYLININNLHVESQIYYCNRILDYLAGNPIDDIKISTYLLDKLLALPTEKPRYVPRGMLKDGRSRINIK